ncbi:MAG: hemolysin family protein [Bacteroidales bacterium]|nr:hemolysin family protein [Bacteroidales bacterium]MDD5974451.1 hemolysin family protein [Bacteroidales bacterium]MDY5193603.1 hemolysin family protein [Candidatus Aphodosoma sp.]
MDTYITIIITLFFSAIFSGMEIAFVSSNKLRFEIEKKKHKISSRVIEFFYKHSEHYISTMLVGNNVVLVIYGIEMAKVLNAPLALFINNSFVIMLLQTLISTIIVLITGEFIPKTIFKSNPNFWLNILAPFIFIIYLILYPITILATFLSKNILRLFKLYNPNKNNDALNKVDLDNLINETIEETHNIDNIENDVLIFQNALDFSDVKLRDCAIPRTEIIALPYEGTTLEDLQNTFTETGYSKILIYKDNIDNIVGYFHSNDLFKKPKNWHDYVRSISIVPETMAANKLMDTFMQDKKSIAVVVDEFGGTAGIITLEDIMEEIFGEIEDEHDSKAYISKQLNEKEFIFSCRLEIDTINQKYNLDIPESDNYVTISGFILHNYQNFPKLNETIKIGKYTFKVLQAHNNRIDVVKLTI